MTFTSDTTVGHSGLSTGHSITPGKVRTWKSRRSSQVSPVTSDISDGTGGMTVAVLTSGGQWCYCYHLHVGRFQLSPISPGVCSD